MTRGVRGAGILVAVLTGFAIFAPPADATPARGGSGGSSFNLDCGSDAVLAGVVLHAGALVDSVEAMCVKVKADGSWSGSSFSKGKAGGSGGGRLNLSCDQNWAVIGIHGRSGALVDKLGVRCGKLGVQGNVAKIVEGNTMRGAGGGGGGSPFDDTCPGGQAGRGLRGRSGALIDQIELACHHPAVPASQQAAPVGQARAAAPTSGMQAVAGATVGVMARRVPSVSQAITTAEIAMQGTGSPVGPGPRPPSVTQTITTAEIAMQGTGRPVGPGPKPPSVAQTITTGEISMQGTAER